MLQVHSTRAARALKIALLQLFPGHRWPPSGRGPRADPLGSGSCSKALGPAVLPQALGQHQVEQPRARRRQIDARATAVAFKLVPLDQILCLMQVATIVAKALLAKIVGHAVAGDTVEALASISANCSSSEANSLSTSLKVLACVHTATQFFIVPGHAEDFKIAVD